MEQVLDWLNENELRAYPLLEGISKVLLIGGVEYAFPDNVLLDLQLVAAEAISSTSTQPQPVYLKSIGYDQGTSLSFTFGSDTHNITTFILNLPNTTIPRYIRNADGNLLVLGEGVNSLIAQFESGYSDEPSSVTIDTMLYVEPTTCLPFYGAWLGVTNIGASPLKKSIEAGFAPSLPLETQNSLLVTGDVKFLAGYNFRVNTASGKIDLEIGRSYGLRMNCTTTFLPEACRDCDELVSYINGIPPDAAGNLRLTAGSNISITSGEAVAQSFTDPIDGETEAANTHTIFVGLSFQSSDLCAPVNITPSPL